MQICRHSSNHYSNKTFNVIEDIGITFYNRRHEILKSHAINGSDQSVASVSSAVVHHARWLPYFSRNSFHLRNLLAG